MTQDRKPPEPRPAKRALPPGDPDRDRRPARRGRLHQARRWRRSPPAPGVGKQTIYRWWPDKGAVVLDAYLALVGAEQDLTVPDSGDLEADLRTGPGLHGGLLGRSGLRAALPGAAHRHPGRPRARGGAAGPVAQAVARGDQGAAARRPAGGADRRRRPRQWRRSCSTARSTTGGCCAPARSRASTLDAVVAMTLRALT